MIFMLVAASSFLLLSRQMIDAAPSGEIQARKRAGNLQAYASKLLRPATWKKLVTGRLDTRSIGKAVAGGGGAASKNREANEPGQLPPGFRAEALRKWQNCDGPVLQIYGTAAPIAASAAVFL